MRLRSTLILLMLLLPAQVIAQPLEIHSEHFLFGYPTGTTSTNDLVIRDLYALSNNDQTKFADWVSYRLTAAEVVGSLDLEREWRADPWLDADETLEPGPGSSNDDYRNAHAMFGYDRGHLAPLASFKGSPHASQVDYLSNIVPQKANLNRGAWQRLEQAEREIVCSGHVLWVMTGPLFDGAAVDPLPSADEGHQVPTGFWKILAFEPGGGLWVAAFTFEQDTPSNAAVVDHLTSVDDIEQRTGLDFLHLMDDALENALESTVLSGAQWTATVPSGSCNSAKTLP